MAGNRNTGRTINMGLIDRLKKMSATQLLALGFLLIIIAGTALLCLPIANRSGRSPGIVDAAFTAVSACCVTGLVVFDTFTQFTGFGQAVILILIQVGGLGFITVATLFSLAANRNIGLRERSLLAEGVGSMQLAGVVRMARRILCGTAALETAGAALLAIRFIPRLGAGRGIWAAVFHSVSAFCNAGFDLMGQLEPYSSLTHFYDDPLVILTVAALIIVGGIGFVVWTDMLDCRFRFASFGFHTKVVLISTLALILGGAALFFFMEGGASMAGMDLGDRLLSSFFQSVTPRTAGFNSIDTASLSPGGQALTMLLMFIGAAPGGTGGGVKITTVAVVMAAAAAMQRRRTDTDVGRYRINEDTIHRAFCSVATYLGVAALAVFVLAVAGTGLREAAFECVSAIGTVGLSLGTTGGLPAVSKAAVMALMYIGRLGSMTVFIAMAGAGPKGGLRNPVGKILIG